ncbi:MAG: phage BR0599 family protein [Kofleriaceae bacterium]
MAYDDFEQSVQDGAPVELYTFTGPTGTYRLTSAEEDVTFGSVFTATQISRSNSDISSVTSQVRALTISLAMAHPLAQVLVGNGIPPRNVEVVISRFHRGDSFSEQIWRGYVSMVDTEGEYARLTVPSSLEEQFAIRLPIAIVQRTCNHMLYDAGCTVDRDYAIYQNEAFMSASAVDSISTDGLTIVVDELKDGSAVDRLDDWATLGEVRRVTDGERRSIVDQTGTTIVLDMPFATLEVGDDLEVYAGCDLTPETCAEKFANIANFGGSPQLPTTNISAPTGFGVRVQV